MDRSLLPIDHADRSDELFASPPGCRQPESRRSQVVERLREAILRGELAAGAHLKQDELCARLGLSPTPVREALRDLESEGLVRHFPHRGVVVSDITPSELIGVLIPVRMAIEAYALPLAAQRMSDRDWDGLADIVAQMGSAARGGRVEAVNNLDLAFHQRAIAASGSEHAFQLWRSVLPRIRLQFGRLAPLHEALEEVELEHRQLLTALRTRDATIIAGALKEHIVDSALQLVENWTLAGSRSDPPG